MFYLWQPINEIDIILFSYDKLFLSLLILSYILFLSTSPFFLETDLLGWKRMKKAITEDTFPFPFPVKIYTPLIYKTCRHPMQAGIMGIIIFSNPKYTLGRLLFVSVMSIGDIIGVLQEEKYLSCYDQYIKYKSAVTNRYIPNILNIFKNPDVKIN